MKSAFSMRLIALYSTYVHYSLNLNLTEEVAQLQEKSFWIFDFASEVVMGQGDKNFSIFVKQSICWSRFGYSLDHLGFGPFLACGYITDLKSVSLFSSGTGGIVRHGVADLLNFALDAAGSCIKTFMPVMIASTRISAG
jgi:hypothetical protein